MESASEKTSVILTCIVTSVILHAAFFCSLGVYYTYFAPEEVAAVKEKAKVEEGVIVMFNPEVSVQEKVPVLPNSVAEIPPEMLNQLSEEELEELEIKIEEEQPNAVVVLPSQFERTVAAQEVSEPIPDTSLYGERNTIAQSDALADAGAPLRPAVGGKVNPDSRDIVESRFSDGKISDEGGTQSQPSERGTPDAIDQAERLLDQLAKAADTPSPETLAAELGTEGKGEKADETLKDIEETINLEKEIARIAEEERLIEQERQKQAKLDESMRLEEQKRANERAVEAAKQAAIAKAEAEQIKQKKGRIDHSKDPFAEAAGLTSEVKRNKVAGSLSRKGAIAARNVKASELGKYEATVMRAVESKWQQECRKYVDRLLPGQLTMAFMVDQRGDVLEVSSLDQNAGTAFQRGMTLRAIKTATIPSMPSKLKSTQRGQPVEVIITFSF